MENNTIMFLDMDGVLADFDGGIDGSLRNMFNPHFFRNLKPLEENLNETILGLQEKGFIIKILSKACVNKNDNRFKGQMIDKAEWIKEYIPCIDELNIIIQGADESKGDILNLYKDNHFCILVDDYSKNLAEWVFNGGIGIKKAKRIKEREWKEILNLKELLEG